MTFPKLEAALTEIKSLVKGLTDSSVISTVNAKVSALEAAIAGELTEAKQAIEVLTGEKTDLTGKLESVQGAFDALNTKTTALTAKIDGAVTDLKLECKADASHEDKFSAVVGAVNAAIEKTGIDTSKLPSAPAGTMDTGKEKLAGLSGLDLAIAAHRLTLKK